MNIVIVDPFSTSPNYSNTIARYLSELEHTVFLVGANKSVNDMSEKGKKIIRRPFINGVMDYPFRKNLYILQNIIRLVLYPFALIKIYFIIRKYNIDILHFQWSHIPILELLLVILAKKKCKVIFTYHNTTRFHGEKHLIKDMLSFGSKILINNIHKVIVHTHYSKKIFSEKYPNIIDNINVVARGRDYFLSENDIDKQAVIPEKNTKILNILFFGQISYYKGVDIIIEAAAFVKNKNFKIQIFGRSELDEKKLFDIALKNGVSDKISWKIKFLTNLEVHNAYLNSDILLFPYRHIDQSAVLMSAFDYGKPIIASKIGGFEEILTHRVNGLLFEKENPRDLAKKIDELMTSADKRVAYGLANLDLIKNWPSWQDIAKLTEKIYK